MTNTLGAKPVIDNSSFKSGIAEMNRALKVLESGFKATAAEMTDWTTDATGLEARMKTLNSAIDIQKQKVSLTRAEYEKVAAEKGRNSAAAQNLEIKLNKETETLNKMERELRETDESLEGVRKESIDASKGVDRLDGKQKEATRSAITLRGALATLGTGLKTIALGAVAVTKAIFAVVAAAAALTVGLALLTVGPASDLAETTSKVGIVFGEAADKVRAFGETSATALGLSENAALTAAGTYGNLLRAMGLTEEESADMSISLVQLAADLASFNNMDPTEVLEKLRAGLTGEAEPLKVLGVNMNEARLKAEALELGLIKQGEALTPAAKAQAAYSIVMKDTALAQGDFERTSEGLANQQRILAAQFEDVKATVGTAFLPIITLGAQVLNDFLQSATFTEGIEGLVGWIERLGNLFSLLFGENADFGAFTSEFTAFIGDLLGSVSGAVAEFAPVALELLSAVATAIIDAIPILLPVAIEIIAQLANFLIQMLPLLIEGGLQIIVTLAQSIAQQLPALIPVVIEALLTIVQTLIDNLPMLIEAALQAVIALANGLADALPTLIPAVIEAIITIVDTLIENLPMLVEAATALILGLAEGLITALPILIAAIPELIGALIDALLVALPQLAEAAGELVGMLVYGILANIPVLLVGAGQLIAELLRLLVNLPKLLFEIGENLIKGLVGGLEKAKNILYDSITKLVNEMISKTKSILGISSPSSVFLNIAVDIVNGLINGFNAIWGSLISTLTGLLNNLLGTATGYISSFISIASDIVDGLIDGFVTKWTELTNTIGGLFSGLISWLKGLLGIASPSAVFGEIAKFSVLGYETEFMKGMKNLQLKAGGAFLELSAVAAGRGAQLATQAVSNSERYTFYGPTYVSGGAAKSLGNAIKRRRF